MKRPLLRVVAAAATAGVIGAACTALRADDQITLTAVFEDVVDLVERAHVRAGDVPIGIITGITLTDDFDAVVTMRVRADTGLPGPDATEAVLSRTSLLGERFVDLRPVGTGGGLEDGDVLTTTRVTSDFEQLVGTGSLLLSVITVESVQAALEVGAQAFAGQGSQLGLFIEDIRAVLGQYQGGSQDLVRLIDTLDDLTAGLAPNAESNAEGIEILDRTTAVLDRQDERLLDTLDELRRLAAVGGDILAEHADEFDNAIRRLRILLEQVNRSDGTVAGILRWVRRHNAHVPNGIGSFIDPAIGLVEGAQVWLDLVLCGFPGDVGGGEGNPGKSCELTLEDALRGSPANPPPQHATSPQCWDGDFDACARDKERYR